MRCRTIGDMTCTGVTESKAATIEDIIEEVASTRITERGGRQMTKDQSLQWRTEKEKVILKNKKR